jgi:hypothetical protein
MSPSAEDPHMSSQGPTHLPARPACVTRSAPILKLHLDLSQPVYWSPVGQQAHYSAVVQVAMSHHWIGCEGEGCARWCYSQ